MSGKGLKRKYVWFNLEKPDQYELWEMAEQMEFGKEVREFIASKIAAKKKSSITVRLGEDE